MMVRDFAVDGRKGVVRMGSWGGPGRRRLGGGVGGWGRVGTRGRTFLGHLVAPSGVGSRWVVDDDGQVGDRGWRWFVKLEDLGGWWLRLGGWRFGLNVCGRAARVGPGLGRLISVGG